MLEGHQPSDDPNLLVGIETSDDAAVYRLNDETAIISTVDFITPPVDDPYWFGLIAAANSISDIYSMGGKPIVALNVVMFPSKKLDMGILREIMRGGHDKVLEAGACLVGGHTVQDDEPKYGLCVNGIVHPKQIKTNADTRPGDVLILTKPLGTGVLFNSVRSGKMPYGILEKDILPLVAELNKAAIETALRFDLHACTDVTGFGLAGHLLEMAKGGGVRIVIDYSALPFYPEALDMYRKGETTGSNAGNREITREVLQIRTNLSSAEEELLFDPQTSGGLLLSVPEDQSSDIIAALLSEGVPAASKIGFVEEEKKDASSGLIVV